MIHSFVRSFSIWETWFVRFGFRLRWKEGRSEINVTTNFARTVEKANSFLKGKNGSSVCWLLPWWNLLWLLTELPLLSLTNFTEHPFLLYPRFIIPFFIRNLYISSRRNSLARFFNLLIIDRKRRKGRNFMGRYGGADISISTEKMDFYAMRYANTHIQYTAKLTRLTRLQCRAVMRRDENVVARWLNADGATAYQGKLLSFLVVSGEFGS